LAEAGKAYDQALLEFRESMKHASAIQIKLAMSDTMNAAQASLDWIEAILATKAPRLRLEQAAIRKFELSPEPELELVQFLYQVLDNSFRAKKMGRVYQIAKILDGYHETSDQSKVDSKSRDNVNLMLGLSSVYVSDLPRATGFITNFRHVFNDLDKDELALIDQFNYHTHFYPDEQKLNESATNLPRVRFQTELGDIVIELYANEAPISVNSFLNLVEKGVFNDTIFHAVLTGRLAEGGVFGTDREIRRSGNKVPNEAKLPNARKHMYGTLSMPEPVDPDSPSTLFAILMQSNANLDGAQTVFGRVVSGMEVVEEFEPTHQIGEEEKIEPVPGAVATVLLKAEILEQGNR